MYHDVTRESQDPRPGPGPDADPAPPDGREARKERVLHTRVPAVLERELKRFADNLRVPVSNLVRTILEDAVSVADAATENVEERLKMAASTWRRSAKRSSGAWSTTMIPSKASSPFRTSCSPCPPFAPSAPRRSRVGRERIWA